MTHPAQYRMNSYPALTPLPVTEEPLIGDDPEPRLGLDPATMTEPRYRTTAELTALGVISPQMADQRLCDTFRRLRTTLFRKTGTDHPVLAVAAIVPQSGTSFIARNLATAIGFDQRRTALLIDCNLSRPRQHELILGAADGRALGLTDYLDDDALSIDDIVYPTGIPRLRIIPAGTRPRQAREWFTVPKLQTLIRELHQRCPERCIVLDSPAMDHPDARVLSDLYDHALLVIPYGRVTENQIADAVLALEPGQFIGTLLNTLPV